MQKSITQTTTRTVTVCDLCGRDASNGFHNHCYVCRRECCLTCSRLVDMGGDRDRRLLEFPVKVCCECEAISDKLHYAERMTAAVEGADATVRRLLDEWRELAKEAKP